MAEPITRSVRRQRKIARTLIRLKHSLQADDEIEAFLLQQRAALTNGAVPRLDVSLDDVLSES